MTNDSDSSPLDLSGLDFGPAWAKKTTPAKDYSKEVGPREKRGDRRGSGGHGGQRGDRNSQGRGQGGDRGQGRGRRDDSGQGRRGGGKGRRDFQNNRPPRQEVPAPEGFTAALIPLEAGLDNLAREIKGSGRTFSVFSLAKLITSARERYTIRFEAPEGKSIFRCKADNSLWLTKEESLRHFTGNHHESYYEIVTSEVDPPKGNFSAVAKCGLSGRWLAPPNYHAYPSIVAQLHAERFSHLSLENYKRKIQIENGEEVVAKWLEQQTTQKSYRPLSDEEIRNRQEAAKKIEAEAAKKAKETTEGKDGSAPETSTETPKEETVEPTIETAAKEEVPTPEASAETPAEETAPDSKIENGEESSEGAPEETTPEAVENEDSTTPTEAEEPKTEESTPLFKDLREVERHFAENHFDSLFSSNAKAWVPGNIASKLLSPALLTLLKETAAEERRYPSKLTPVLCRQLTGRHLAVFKWNKKLKAGPARPHSVPEELTLAERPQTLLAWVKENSGQNIEALWKACLPAEPSDEIKHGYYSDLHWLLNQGFVLLLEDGTLYFGKDKPAPQSKQAPAKKNAKKQKEKTTEKPSENKTSDKEEPKGEISEVKAEEPEVNSPNTKEPNKEEKGAEPPSEGKSE